MSLNQPWRLDLRAGIELTNPDGQLVALPYRKVGDLLAKLATARNRTLSRDQVAKALWPEASRFERQTNLRQCLARLRSVLGSNAVSSNRSSCGLAQEALVLVVDPVDQGAEKDQLRREPDPLIAFRGLIEWLAVNDPSAIFSILRTNPELGLTLAGSGFEPFDTFINSFNIRISDLSKTHTRSHELGWTFFWRGSAVVRSDVKRALVYFDSAFSLACEDEDWELLAFSAFWRGVSLILMNRVPAASAIADRAATILDRPGRRQYMSRVEKLLATVMLHSGNTQEAVLKLERLNHQRCPNRLEFATDEALRALYLAFYGRADEADRILGDVQPILSSVENSRGDQFAALARVVVEVSEPNSNAVGMLEAATAKFACAGEHHLELYCRETMAKRLWDLGKRNDALYELGQSQRLRHRLSVAYTEWDLSRLGPITASLA